MSAEGGLFQKRELPEEELAEFTRLMESGHAAFDAEDFQKALEYYHAASRIDGSGSEVWSCLGLTFTNLDFPREAWRSHKLAISADPDSPDAIWYAAEFLVGMEDYELANFLLERYVQVEADRERLAEARSLQEECRAHINEHQATLKLKSTGIDKEDDEAEEEELEDDELEGFGYEEGEDDEFDEDEDEDYEDEPFPDDIEGVESDAELSFVADMTVVLTGLSGRCSKCGMMLPEDAPYCFGCGTVHFYDH